MSDAAKRAAARKAKILARGNTGLQKLAQTARGEEADKLYGNDTIPTPSPKASSPSTPVETPSAPSATSTSEPKPSWVPPPTTSAPSSAPFGRFGGVEDEPEFGGGPQLTAEQRQMQQQLAAMFGSLGAPSPGGAGGAGEQGDMPDFQRLMAQMMGGLGPDPTANNLLGNGDGADAIDPSQNPFAALQGMGGAGGMPDFSRIPGLAPSRQRSKVDKYFPLIHYLAIIAFAVFSIGWWEPALRATAHSSTVNSLTSWSSRWAGLAGGRDVVRVIKHEVLGGIEFVPIFWAFTTLELILQTTRFFILKTYKDGALLIFLVGSAIILASYLNGTPLPQA